LQKINYLCIYSFIQTFFDKYNLSMETGKSFKIRKTGFNKTRNLQDIQDQELVANLDDLRIS